MKRLLIAAILCTGAAYADDSKESLSNEVAAKHCSYHAKEKHEKKKAKKAKKAEKKAKNKAYNKAKKDKKKAHKESLKKMKKQRKADKKKHKKCHEVAAGVFKTEPMQLAKNIRIRRGPNGDRETGFSIA